MWLRSPYAFRKYLGAVIAVGIAAITVACDDDTTTTLIVENDGPSPITISLGASAWRETVASGVAGTFKAPGSLKQVWISGGTADTALALKLDHATHRPHDGADRKGR